MSSAAGAPALSLPANTSTLVSPFQFGTDVTSIKDVDHTQLLLDGTSVYSGGILAFNNKWLFAQNGRHTLNLIAFDSSGNQLGSTAVNIAVTNQTSPAALTQLQTIRGWDWCTAKLNGDQCAAGYGDATSIQDIDQAQPSKSGSSTLFTLGGSKGYSNALWWYSLGGGTPLTTFTYSLDFYIDHADAPEALEFDVNQSYGGMRYTFGTECSYKYTGFWDVWDPLNEKWAVTSAPCPQVSSQQWHHLEWQFERVNGQVHYISVSLDGQSTQVDIYLNAGTDWMLNDIDIAFQLDGDFQQTPYKVWLDNVNLTVSY